MRLFVRLFVRLRACMNSLLGSIDRSGTTKQEQREAVSGLDFVELFIYIYIKNIYPFICICMSYL